MPCVNLPYSATDISSRLNDEQVRQWRKRQCGAKRRYASKQTAKRAAIDYRRKTGDRVDYYECPWCEWWHIGHRRLEKSKELQAEG